MTVYSIPEKYKPFITYDGKMYSVWDETQAYLIGTTFYPRVAMAMLDAYSTFYLGE